MGELFDLSGTWLKGNLHMHTTRSDGRLEPEAAAALYEKAGYDFIALTDHWVQNERVKTDRFLILNGCEWDTGDMVHSPVYHIVGVGMDSKVELTRSSSRKPQEIIDAVTAAGGCAILAHPAWSVTNPADCLQLTGLSGAEVYNSISNLPWNGRRADSSLYFDLWAGQGKFFSCVASDDSHFYNGEHTYSYIMLNADALTPESIKKSLRSGNFYATQGPRFESICMENGVVRVICSKVEKIVFYSNTVWCDDRVTSGGVTSAVYRVKPTDRYVRVELVDGSGKIAWSSPFAV
ncbi:MAG TPA: hypothetical protein VHO71_01555 [Caproiciproducens sp.]|nr:hypothetical protein [Caproiciproducens sp.]